MQFIRTPCTTTFARGSIVAIGNFDGLHLGHQATIRKLVDKAFSTGLPSVVVTFEPSPKQFFQNGRQLRVMRLQDKLQRLKALGVEFVVALKFNAKLAAVSHQAFLEQFLVSTCRVRHIFVGEDFCFGQNRLGDTEFLKSQAKAFGFEVEIMPMVLLDDNRVSSTLVRDFLEQGRLDKVQQALGRPFSISAKVCHGDKRGRLLGFPTANIHLPKLCLPRRGVYCVRIKGIGPKPLSGVCNLGVRPTVDGRRLVCETHIFDFAADLYGKRIEVEFLKHLRDELRFESLDALRNQIALDSTQAKAYLIN